MDQENIAGSARVLTKKDKKARTAVDGMYLYIRASQTFSICDPI